MSTNAIEIVPVGPVEPHPNADRMEGARVWGWQRCVVHGAIRLSFIFGIALAGAARGETYRVGPGRAVKSLSAVAAKLRAGDVVEIDPGTYREVVRLAADGTAGEPITLRGAGGARTVFDAEGIDTSGVGAIPRGVLQVEGAYYVIEHLELKNARNGMNAAGVRLLHSTDAVLRDCHIHHCDMGVFGDDRATAKIEACDVAFNGTEKFGGGSHNFYMQGNRVVVRGCHIHDALFGQNYKSRAHYNELWYNWIADSAEGEVGIVDSEETDRPNSNALLVGNMILSSRERTGNAAKFVLFGSESGHAHDGTLYLFRNTFIAGSGRINFITLDDAKAAAVVMNNIFVGSDRILNTPKPPVSIVAGENWMPSGAPLPPGWGDGSASPVEYVDGDGEKRPLRFDPAALPVVYPRVGATPRPR